MTSRALAVQSHQLSIIGPIVDDYLAAPTGTRIVRKVAGFEVEEEVSASSEWRSGERSYRENTKALQDRLSARGVVPIAILPKAWWDQIVRDHGFYDMQPNEDGRIRLDVGEHAKNARIDQHQTLFVISAMAATFYMVGWHTEIGYGYAAQIDRFLVHSMAAIASAASLGIAFIVIGGRILKKSKNRFLAVVGTRIYMLTRGRRKIVSDMIVRGGAKNKYDSVVRSMVTLPIPPDDVKDVLIRIRGMDDIRVAADPGAVSFSPSPAQVIVGGIIREQAEEEELKRRIAADPIVYVVVGNAVAIVAQFGVCPIEKAAIEVAVRSQTSF